MTCILSLSCFLVGGETLRQIMKKMFEFSGYLIHSVIIDLYVFTQVALYNVYVNQPYQNLPLQNSPRYVKVLIIIIKTGFLVSTLIAFDLFTTTIMIIFVELVMVGFVAMIVYGVIFSS